MNKSPATKVYTPFIIPCSAFNMHSLFISDGPLSDDGDKSRSDVSSEENENEVSVKCSQFVMMCCCASILIL